MNFKVGDFVRVIWTDSRDRFNGIEEGKVYRVVWAKADPLQIELSAGGTVWALVESQIELVPYHNSSLMKALRDEF